MTRLSLLLATSGLLVLATAAQAQPDRDGPPPPPPRHHYRHHHRHVPPPPPHHDDGPGH